MSRERGISSGGPWGKGHNNACNLGEVGEEDCWGCRGRLPEFSFSNPDSLVLLPDTSPH